jgi:cellulose synthase/poly-beta-1,6-N-acetylglucosamine synthase-like glycosyltransferase
MNPLALGAYAIDIALSLIGGVLLLISGYLMILTLAALFGRHAPPPPGPARRRFAILIPAHNEQALIGRLLDNLRTVDYPAALAHVYVVADNCDDATATIARDHGARVYERIDPAQRAKGFALRWLIEQIAASGAQYDAFVVLDADSVVSANFLRSMDARLERGAEAIQAYYSVLNAADSPVAALRYAALAAVHYLRPLGRATLGLSSGLKGNGMCFSASVLERFAWRWFTLAEDVEFHLALVNAGLRVEFAPEATVLADMPVTLQQSSSQNDRWERGRLELLRNQGGSLVVQSLRRRSLVPLDAIIEQLIPPLSVPLALGAVCLLLSLATGALVGTLLATVALLGLALYVFASLLLVRASWTAYRALTFAPLYVAWKVGLYARAVITQSSGAWIRTSRQA